MELRSSGSWPQRRASSTCGAGVLSIRSREGLDGDFALFVSRETVRSRSCPTRSGRRSWTVSRETVRRGSTSVYSCRLCRPAPVARGRYSGMARLRRGRRCHGVRRHRVCVETVVGCGRGQYRTWTNLPHVLRLRAIGINRHLAQYGRLSRWTHQRSKYRPNALRVSYPYGS